MCHRLFREECSSTFIIDNMGYDIFPVSWKRVEGLVALNEGITSCLADSDILYAMMRYLLSTIYLFLYIHDTNQCMKDRNYNKICV